MFITEFALSSGEEGLYLLLLYKLLLYEQMTSGAACCVQGVSKTEQGQGQADFLVYLSICQ